MKNFLWATRTRKIVTISILVLVLIGVIGGIVNPKGSSNANIASPSPIPSSNVQDDTVSSDDSIEIIGSTPNGAGKIVLYKDSSTVAYEVNGAMGTVVKDAQPCTSHEDNSPTTSPWIWNDLPTSEDPYSGEVVQVCDSAGNLKITLQLS